jgi:hypothetical protein
MFCCARRSVQVAEAPYSAPLTYEVEHPLLDMREARMCIELSDIVYFSKSSFAWCSSLREPEEPSMGALPVHVRRKLGVYAFSGGQYRLAPLAPSTDGRYGTALVKDGILFEDTTDSEALFVTCPEKKLIVLVFRGTESLTDGIVDIRLKHGRSPCAKSSSRARVHSGFAAAYRSMRGAVRGTVVELLARGCGLAAGEQFERVVVCGHSLGGALATLCASDLAGYLGAKCAVSSYTFGSPRVGNAVFASEYAAR